MIAKPEEGMSLIVKTITRLTVGLILLYGIYIVSHGHLSPGGGFAGGVIIALSFIHLFLAFGKEAAFKRFPKAAISFMVSVGMILFLGMAVLGFTGGYFFYNFLPPGEPFRLFSAGIIPLCYMMIGLIVGAGLIAIFVALVLLKLNGKENQ